MRRYQGDHAHSRVGNDGRQRGRRGLGEDWELEAPGYYRVPCGASWLASKLGQEFRSFP